MSFDRFPFLFVRLDTTITSRRSNRRTSLHIENMSKLKICYLNVFENHLFPLTTLLNEKNQSLEIYQTKIGSVGSWCWESAICLAEFCYDHMFDSFREKRIVEIGSGTGIVGLQLAGLGGHVTLTDREEYLDLLNYNIRKNNEIITGSAEAKSLFWGDAFDENVNWWKNLDFVVVANCVYHSIELDDLIQTISYLCPDGSSTSVLCCYEIRNDGIRKLIDEFHHRLEMKNFVIEQIETKDFRVKYQNDYNTIVKCQRGNQTN